MRILVNLADWQVAALDKLSKAEKKSRAAVIRSAVDDYLAQRRVRREQEAFGLWGKKKIDGLAYQRRIRREW
jgi:metal-responsive CopG/Arc/MetJ family transcriptional regulator